VTKLLKLTILIVSLGLLFLIGNNKNNKIVEEKVISSPTLFVEKKEMPEMVKLRVPFTAQAPTGNWEDIKQGNGCEEASILMAFSWTINQEINKKLAVDEISKMSDFSLKLLGHFHDISNEDTIKLFREYFKFENLFLEKEVNIENIKKTLSEGKILIAAVNGDLLANPYYQIPKPANHKLVIIGYDEKKQEFITHDPGTSRGENFRYDYHKLMEAITDYPTGYRESFKNVEKSLIVVEKL